MRDACRSPISRESAEGFADRNQTMKSTFKTFPHFQVRARTFLATVAVLTLSMPHIFAGVVSASYSTGAEVPVSSNGFTATGKTVNITLNYAPAPGTELMVVKNTGPGLIGTFSNLAQGQTVALSYGGVIYNFVANYNGGTGHDLVLLWTSGEESLPAATLKKLDVQIVLALKKSRGKPPFDKPTSLEPDIPIKDDAGRVLVDIEASVSKELLNRVALVGGQVINGSVTARTFRAMAPLSQLETLAARADVRSISTARPIITSGVEASPAP
jgi:hypothetical protein